MTIEAGTRVHHWYAGPGTVTATPSVRTTRVLWDDGSSGLAWTKDLGPEERRSK